MAAWWASMDDALGHAEARDTIASRAPFCLDPDQATILVADDSPVERLILKGSLDRLGWPAKVVYAEDGEDAWQRLQGLEPPVVVLTDLEMPRLDGRRLVQRIRNDPATCTVPAFVISSRADAAHVQACMAAGATAFFPKPSVPTNTFALVKVLHAFSFQHCFTGPPTSVS